MSLVEKSSVTPTTEPVAGSPEDPFRLGWRYVRRTLPDGEEEFDQIPLTLEDLLFPEEEDFAVQIEAHISDCFYLYGALKLKLTGRPGTLVVADHRVRFNVPGLRPLGPDVAVFFDFHHEAHTGTLEVAELGVRPILVVEITSPDTRAQDLHTKKNHYHQAGVEYYLLIDARIRDSRRVRTNLFGFRHTPTGYEPFPLDDQGRFWVEPIDLWFRVDDNQIRCVDGTTGQTIDPFVEQALARQEATRRAEVSEAQIQIEAAARSEAEAQTLIEAAARSEAEAQTLIEAAARSEAEAQTLIEAAARLSAEAQIAALQAELRRLRGEE